MSLELLVDDTPVDADALVGGTVEEALRHVQSEFCAPDKLIVRVRCDSRDVPGDEMTATLKKKASSIACLEIFTGSKAALVTEAMAQASACLEETEAGCRRCAELLTEGKTSEGIDALGACLHVWQQIHEAVAQSVEMLEIDLEQTMIGDEPLGVVFGKPKEVLTQVRDALKAQDHVMLADILQYELTGVTTVWFAVINRLAAVAAERAGETGSPASSSTS